MAKKRRVTPEQARLLAIRYIQESLANEAEFGTQIIPENTRRELWYFRDALPPNWSDGNTSDKSWDLLWQEMSLQLNNILKGLDREAVRIRLENPDMRYTVQFPLSTQVAPGQS